MAQKTPISLMNELCKANSIAPEYKVIDENGPPHQKTFKVQLSLPNVGCYEGIGQTIKGAKHKAAQLGLETSGLTKPERKPKILKVMPTVELNSLAMKLGKVVQYRDLPNRIESYHSPNPLPSSAYSQFSSQFKPYNPGFPTSRIPYRRPPTKITVSLKIGEKEYFGEGHRRKEARHNAAVKALADLRKQYDPQVKLEKTETNEIPSQDSLNTVEKDELSLEQNVKTVDSVDNAQSAKPFKSEISQVYEIASKRKLKIDFEVTSSSGPPHNRTFRTSVTVGEFKAEGEGPAKKASKKAAAIKILEELNKLPPLVATSSRRKGRLYNHGGYPKKAPRDLDPSLNPISMLGQLRQRRKESLPVYTLVGEEGIRNKEFTIQVQVDSHTVQGSGANKKEAKKNAAEAMLQFLDIRSSNPVGTAENDDGKQEVQKESQKYFQLINWCSDQLSNQASFQSPSIEVGCMSADLLTSSQFFSEFLSGSSSKGDGDGGTDHNDEVRKRSGIKRSIKKVHIYSLFRGQKQNKEEERNADKESTCEGRQLPPGLLPILPEMASQNLPAKPPPPQAKPQISHPQQIGPTLTVLNRAPGAPVGKPILDEILQDGNTPSLQKLQQLAESTGFQVQYQDTTQENNEQCLTVVTISTVPPLICRGFGATVEQAFEHAAANALVHLLQPVGPPSGPVVDHHTEKSTSKAPGQRNIHVATSLQTSTVQEEPTGGKAIV